MFILCKWSYGIEMSRCWNPLRGIAPQKTFRFNMRKAFQSDCECSCVSSRVILVLSYFPRSSSSRRYDAQIGSCKRTILFLGWLRALSRVLGSHCIITLLWLTDYVGKHLKTFAQSGWLYASILPGFDKSSWIVYTVYLCGYPAIAICLQVMLCSWACCHCDQILEWYHLKGRRGLSWSTVSEVPGCVCMALLL